MLPHELEQLWQEIQLAFDEGTFASLEAQAKINRFMEEGPDALDYWTGKIKEAEALALGYAERLGKLKANLRTSGGTPWALRITGPVSVTG